MMIESSASADLSKSEQHLPKISDGQIYHSYEKSKPSSYRSEVELKFTQPLKQSVFQLHACPDF